MTDIGECCMGVSGMITRLADGFIKIITMLITIIQQTIGSTQEICSEISR